MIISSRRRMRSPFGKIVNIFRGPSLEPQTPILVEDRLLFEIKKECARVDRRPQGGEFALILLGGPDNLDLLANVLRSRLRITDTLGWKDDRLAVLLPETCLEGARTVANEIVEIGLTHDLAIETEVLIYPWDDPIAKGASELNPGKQPQTVSRPRDHTAAESAFNRSHFERNRHFAVSLPTPLWKRTMDIMLAGGGLVLLSPVLLIAAIAIKLNSPGPVFFRQEREGKDGVPFGMVKLRTMIDDAEQKKAQLLHYNEQDGPAFKIGDDPRVTTVGRYLRRCCVDELPQLINVLLGDMSLVGPRPLPVVESANCEIWQRKRLQVLPGITCIWQVRGGRDTRFDDWMRMDMEYLQRRSFLFDLLLIFQTALLALLHRGSV